jgi:hypothetical protein
MQVQRYDGDTYVIRQSIRNRPGDRRMGGPPSPDFHPFGRLPFPQILGAHIEMTTKPGELIPAEIAVFRRPA